MGDFMQEDLQASTQVTLQDWFPLIRQTLLRRKMTGTRYFEQWGFLKKELMN